MKTKGNRRVRLGGWRVIVCVLALALALLCGSILKSLPATYTRLDITEQRLYTLSDDTNALLDGLTGDVKILCLADADSRDVRLRELIARYEARSSRVRFQYIDAASAAYYTASELTANSLIITNGEYDAICEYEDLYRAEYETRGQYQYLTDYLYCAEGEINRAISSVTSELPFAYVLSGHGETVPESGLQKRILEAGMHTKSLYLSELSAVPEDALLIVINAPQTDITQTESALLSDYIDAGGSVFLVTDPKYGELANLSAFAKRAGLSWMPGIVMDAKQEYLYNPQYPYYLMPDAGEDELCSDLANSGSRAIVSLAHAIEVGDASGYRASALLLTSDQSFLKPTAYTDGVMTYAEGDATGPLAIAAISRGTSGGGLFWLSSGQCLTDAISEMSGNANYTLASSVLSLMRGEAAPLAETLPPVSLIVEAPSYTDARFTATFAVLFALPALSILIGAICAAKRKKKTRAA